jgi:GT2 family glycosyltransferase
MPTFFFSLVLYRHSLDDIAPLLSSLNKLLSFSQKSEFNIFLCIYEARVSNTALVSESQIFSLYPLLPFHYRSGPNVGFGPANNINFRSLSPGVSDFFVVVNPDISFAPASLLSLFLWVKNSTNVSCVAPLISLPNGSVQYSAKKNPTFLSLILGRLPSLLVFPFFKSYDSWHKNLSHDYHSESIISTYLSGCFLVIPAHLFELIGGFSEVFFLHLEDADIVRRLASHGQTIHNPIGIVTHQWARGSHRSFSQMFHLSLSYLHYIRRWGFVLF